MIPPCASLGVQLKTPVTGWMLAPAGGDTRLKAKALAGCTSMSDAEIANESGLPSFTVLGDIGANEGALLRVKAAV